MRTATTLHETSSGWTLAYGPDVPADKQDAAYRQIGNDWPKDVRRVRFQFGDRPCKIRTREDAVNMVSQMAAAQRKAAEKLALSERNQAESEARSKKEVADKAKAAAEANTKAIAEKEASKKLASKQSTTARSAA